MTKTQFRKKSLENLRKQIPLKPLDKEILSKIIENTINEEQKRIEASGENRKIKILSYMSTEEELDIDFLKDFENIELYLPKIIDDNNFKAVLHSGKLMKNRFKILEPVDKNHEESRFDIAFVPIIGMDASFRRIGRGKGMYDKFFTNAISNSIIFVTKKLQYIDNVVTNDRDIKGDYLIDGTKFLKLCGETKL